MNILMIGHEQMINGASYSMINLIDTLKDKCNFIVISPFETGPFVDAIKSRNIEMYFVPFYRWVEVKDNDYYINKKNWQDKYDRVNQQLALKLALILKDKNIDIIHSNTSVVDFGYRLSKIMNIPHIWHIREFGEDDFNMYPLCSYDKYYRKIADDNYLICISKAVMEKFKDNVSPLKLFLIYNGVGKENIYQRKNYNLDKKKKLVCLQSGMILKNKGQDITVKAIDMLINKGYNIELLLAGRGRIEDLGIDANKKWLKCLGQVSDLKELRKKVDVEIVSSRKEAFGRVTVEAMMSGLAVIGSNSGGTLELIDDNKNGLLFEQDNVLDLADKIEYLYNNRNEIERLGKKAYSYSKDKFLIDRCAKEIYSLYNKVRKEKDERFK